VLQRDRYRAHRRWRTGPSEHWPPNVAASIPGRR
jgi:hypothetical protein